MICNIVKLLNKIYCSHCLHMNLSSSCLIMSEKPECVLIALYDVTLGLIFWGIANSSTSVEAIWKFKQCRHWSNIKWHFLGVTISLHQQWQQNWNSYKHIQTGAQRHPSFFMSLLLWKPLTKGSKQSAGQSSVGHVGMVCWGWKICKEKLSLILVKGVLHIAAKLEMQLLVSSEIGTGFMNTSLGITKLQGVSTWLVWPTRSLYGFILLTM